MTEKERKSFWTTLPGILTGLAAVIAAVTGLYLALADRQPDSSESPAGNTVTREVQSGESSTVQDPKRPSKQDAYDLKSRFIEAYQDDRITTILAMTDAPFYIFGDFLYRQEDIKEKFDLIFEQKGGNFKILRSSIKTLGQLQQDSAPSQRVDEYGVSLTSVVETLGLVDSDFVLDIDWSIQIYSGTISLLTRAKNGDLVLAGWWSIQNSKK